MSHSPEPRYARRLSDMILIAFHNACDQKDVAVAWELLNALEFIAMRQPTLRAENERRVKEGLVAAQTRLWHLRNPEPEDGPGRPGSSGHAEHDI